MVRSKLSPCSGSAALRQLNPIHEKGLLRAIIKKVKRKFLLLNVGSNTDETIMILKTYFNMFTLFLIKNKLLP